jgi:hypothetical protein
VENIRRFLSSALIPTFSLIINLFYFFSIAKDSSEDWEDVDESDEEVSENYK